MLLFKKSVALVLAAAVAGAVSGHAVAATDGAYRIKHHFRLTGHVRPLPRPHHAPDYAEPTYDAPAGVLFNLQQQYNPIEPTLNDFPRDYYPGLGLYR